MTRRIVYGVSLWVFLGAVACTIASIALPNWVSYSSPVEGHDPIKISYGLHKRCSSVTGECTKFPQYDDCHGDDRSFCSIWRTVGFAMNFSVVLLLACAVAYVTILVGGRGTREVGWKILCPLLAVVALAQLVAMSLVAGVFEHDSRFFVGWSLDKSWILCTVSWTVLLVNAASVLGAAFCLEPEDDYEMIP
ncbi:hypothetical protein CERZMDRAFT_35154 [Cercospora zeae-maydis SCOH1-5]|uniref:MARVEL domain-containing protein n=1 Tax=Cercospora zeae-maydis SCOH1-5 TaxID=717836 RepID=A0A6A6FQZ3_9PEZI|nr:hypothetical protein CERZMDRAFT_35154 [Cercospora zeae-maydis SCOH1-5]